APQALADHAGKYLTVVIAREAYAIAASDVREIIRFQKITPVAQMPDAVKGVIDLRGRVVPVVDLRARFGFTADSTERICIVVVRFEAEPGLFVPMGLIVDAVDAVEHFTAEALVPPPAFGSALSPDHLLGLAKTREGVKLLIDPGRLLRNAL
ncbi:MAG TPA: chemotaxis protein CheW, partial [Opitutaceae bacterium]